MERLRFEEKKAALEEGNRLVRLANLQRFNPPKEHVNRQPNFAWGVDQRKVINY